MVIFGLNSASILAQVNVGATPATFLGIFLAVAGAALYFIRNVKPELSRDHDIFFAAVGLVCGCILIFQGWRLDPILQFGQLMLVGSTVFFAYESIRLRGIATEQAKRNTPIEDERPVSRNYQYSNRRSAKAERVEMDLEPLPYYDDDEYEDRPRIRGSRDERRPNRGADDYQDDSSRRPNRGADDYQDDSARRTSRRSTPEKTDTTDRTRRRASRPSSSSEFDQDDWNSSSSRPSNNENWDTPASDERRSSRRSSPSERPERDLDDTASNRPRRSRRPSSESPRKESDFDESIPTADYTDYVDYKPLEAPKEKPERPNKFDDDDVSMS
jgi:Ycf66 protein N-terminus